MPTVLRVGPYRFFFYSNEGHEPPHVHVEATGGVEKLWLDPVRVERQGRFGDQEMRDVVDIVKANEQKLLEAWHDFFP
jgi:hypothetical protein